MGFLAAYVLLIKLARDGMLRLEPTKVPDLVLNCCIFGVLVGGRMGYVLFYDLPHVLSQNPLLRPEDRINPMLWDFLDDVSVLERAAAVWDGGMSAHGGVLFTILALAYFAWRRRRQGVSLINLGDASCMVVPLGLCFGRIANFINGELYGHPSDVPWAVKFPSEFYAPTNNTQTLSDQAIHTMQSGVADFLRDHWQSLTQSQVEVYLQHHPTFSDEMQRQFGPIHLDSATQLSAIKHAIAQQLGAFPFDHASRELERFTRDIGSWWQGPHTALTDVMYRIFGEILPARHPSQLYEALLEGVLLFLICWTIGRLWRKDGMASGAFLTLYPVMRIIGEQFRVGDTPTKILGIDMSFGVIYSLVMFAGGAAYWIYWIRRDRRVEWLKPAASALASATLQLFRLGTRLLAAKEESVSKTV